VADFLVFDEGAQRLLTSGNGLPSTCYFLLSTKAVSDFNKSDTLAGGLAEITGTGYTRQSQAGPAPAGENTSFAQMTWSTGAATDWPNNVKTVVLVDSANNVGKAICAWNLVTGGGAVNMGQVNTSLQVTPSLNATSA